MRATIEVKHQRWAWGDPVPPLVLVAGVYTLEEALTERPELDPAALLKAAAAAAAASAGVELHDLDQAAQKLVGKAVETDEISVAEQEKAQADGRWQLGNLEQAIVTLQRFLEDAPGEIARCREACELIASGEALTGAEPADEAIDRWEQRLAYLERTQAAAPAELARIRAELDRLGGEV